MPRHPPNALTSRLKIHTTNDSTARLKCSLCVSRGSAIIVPSLVPHCPEAARRRRRHRFHKPIHNVKDEPEGPRIAVARMQRQTGCLILDAGGAYRDRTDDLKLAKLALSQLS